MAFLELRDISKSYGARRVLAGINLAVEEGEFVSIIGKSAAGKTTLLKIASGLVTADAGSVTIGGKQVSAFPSAASIVFQNYSLLPWFSALENVRLAVESAFPDWSKQKQKDHAAKYLGLVGLGNAHSKRPGQLSGGMRQRVAIARSFAVEPQVLFLDEPFGALDALTRATLQVELGRLCEGRNPRATVVMITNSVDEAMLLSDRIVTLGRGPNNEAATLSEAIPISFARPRDPALLLHDPEAVRVKADVTATLIGGQQENRKPRMASPSVSRVPVEVCSE